MPRLRRPQRVWAAVENTTRNEMIGVAEVADFGLLGLALRGIPGDPVAAVGDRLWVTLVAEEGVIPLQATLIHIRGGIIYGVQLDAPSAPGEHFLIRLYERAAASPAHTPPHPA